MRPSELLSVTTTLLATLALAGTATAEPINLGVAAESPPRPVRAGTFTVEGQAGLGSPIGLIGAAASVAVAPFLDVGVGAGKAIDGLQVAGTVRLHQRKAGARAYLAASVSQGRYVDNDWWDGGEKVFEDARWVSVEVGSEGGQRGMFGRWGVGLTKMVSSASCIDTDHGDEEPFSSPCREPSSSYLYPFLSFTVGYRY